MRYRVLALVAVLALTAVLALLPSPAGAAPLSNDAFADAKTVALGGTGYFDQVDDTTAATTEAGEQTGICGTTIGRTTWYKYTPGSKISIKANTFQSTYNTVLVLYQQTGSTIGSLVALGCSNNVSPLISASRITAILQAGVTYYFQVGGQGTAAGLLKFRVKQRIFRPGVIRDNKWFLNDVFDGSADFTFRYGAGTDTFLAGDWVGNGVSLPWFRRDKIWYPNDWFDETTTSRQFGYGRPTDTPVLGDWNGDRSLTPGVVRGATWYLNDNLDGSAEYGFTFGRSTDRKIVGDWDGDGDYTPGVVRGGVWYLSNDLNGSAEIAVGYGRSSDIPVVGDWDGDGDFTLGVVRGGVWYLNNGFDGTADITPFKYGLSSDKPVVGDWNGVVGGE